jgi:TetR/AcrR family transcriptional regulator, mexJK operon transcriptional repressor
LEEKTGTRSRGETKRAQILEGGRRIFLRDGFAAASTDEISREAGVSKRTLYAYYPSKEDLFSEVLRTLTIENPRTMVLESIRAIEPRSREELREALVEIAGRVISTVMQPGYLSLIRTIIADSHRFPQLADIFRSTVPEQGIREGSAVLERARGHGVGNWKDSEVAIRMFMGPLLSYLVIDGLFRPEGQHRTPGPEKIEEMVDMYMKAIS